MSAGQVKATMDKKMISLRVGQYVICMKDTQHKNTEKPDDIIM